MNPRVFGAIWSGRKHTGSLGEKYEELANRTNFKREKARGNKHQKRDFSRRLPIATFIYNSPYSPITNSQESFSRVSVHRQNKDQPSALHG